MLVTVSDNLHKFSIILLDIKWVCKNLISSVYPWFIAVGFSHLFCYVTIPKRSWRHSNPNDRIWWFTRASVDVCI